MKKRNLLSALFIGLLCLTVIVPLFLIGTAENYDLSVYISASGNETNSGLTEEEPVSTFAEALAVATSKGSSSEKVRFVLLSDISVVNNPYGSTPFSFDLTVTGKSGTETFITTKNYVHHMGNTRYENMRFSQGGTTNYSFLCGNGYDLVLGEGLSCTPNAKGYYINLAGGVYNGSETFVSDSKLTVLSGQWETLYAGSYQAPQQGNVTLYAENCQIYTNVGTCYTKSHTGTSNITLKNCEVAIKESGMLQGGPTNAAGSLSDKLTLTVENCQIRDFGVGFKCPITAPLMLSVKDCSVQSAYSVTATGEKEIHLSATAGNTLDLSPATTIEATTFTGGGTLILGSEGLLVAEEVFGSTALSLGESPALRAYAQAPSETPDNAFTYSGTTAIKTRVEGEQKIWTLSACVTLKAPESMTLTLSTGFDEGSAITPNATRTENGETFYSYYGLSAGNYRYNVKGGNYYQITKNILLTEEKLANDLLIDCTPALRAGTGFEPSPSANSNVKDYTDEMRQNFLSDDPANWEEYGFVFSTPYFTRASYETGLHQATTQSEMIAYLEKCVAESENLYLFSLGKSPSNGFDIPMVIFTSSDLSDAKTLEQAAAICKANGKLTVQYQAQVHGNEPAGGEGALAMVGALGSDWGEKYLGDLNICIIPRINTDGSYAYTRNQVTHNRNLNRDYLLVEAEEIPMILNAYNLFTPELVVDGHEYTVGTSSTSGAFNDAMLGTGGNESADSRFEETGVNMILEAFDHLKEHGLTAHFYSSQDDSTDPCTARAYYQMRGSVSLLLETSGIHTGQNGFHRRVITQFLCMETYLDYAKANKNDLRSLSQSAKAHLTEAGSTYSENRIFALNTTTVAHTQTYPKPVINYATGLTTGTKNVTAKSEDNVQRSRPLPTAYVIPKDDNSAAILRIANAHRISYYELEANSAAYLLGYEGAYDASTKAVTEVSLTKEQLISFPSGAYVFPMNQDSALILAAMFEPDNEDIYNTSDKTFTLAQKGTVPYENGSFAMYRSQRALTDGKIDFVAAPEAPQGLSVTHPEEGFFVGKISGLDSALSYEIRHENESAFTLVPAGSAQVASVPFGFVEIRFPAQDSVPASKSILLEILPPESALPIVYLAPNDGSDSAFGTENAPVKSLDRAIALLRIMQRYSEEKATLIFAETLTTTSAITFPSHDFPLYITSESGVEGIRSSKNITFGGETLVDDFTFTYTGTGYVYIVADGHKLTLGEKVKSVAEKDVYYMPVGGGHEKAVESADLTVLAGTWRNVYAGGYRGSVSGNVSLTVKNCAVVSHIQNSYSGRTSGSLTVSLENVSVGTSILCGNAAKEDVKGDVSLTAENCAIAQLYAGSRDAGNMAGKVNVTLINCTARDLYGNAKNETGTVAESHLTLIGTTPSGTVSGWTDVTEGSPYAIGDVDGSGEVDMDDAIYLLFHTNFPEDYPINQPCDFDGSGAVDPDDAIYLLYHVYFPERFPL